MAESETPPSGNAEILLQNINRDEFKFDPLKILPRVDNVGMQNDIIRQSLQQRVEKIIEVALGYQTGNRGILFEEYSLVPNNVVMII